MRDVSTFSFYDARVDFFGVTLCLHLQGGSSHLAERTDYIQRKEKMMQFLDGRIRQLGS